MQGNVIRRRLTNGARVIMVPNSGTNSTLAMVRFRVGSRHETPEEAGLAHFLEHMFWRGTAKRPGKAELMRDIVRMGAMSNAFTSWNTTGYYVWSNHLDLPASVEILGDILLNSLFDPQMLEVERGVVLTELQRRDDDPHTMTFEKLFRALYPVDPIGRQMAGTPDVVSRLTRDQMVAFRDRHYIPQNMVITLTGRIDDDVAAGLLLDRELGQFGVGASDVDFDWTVVGGESPRVVMVQREDLQQSYVNLGFEAYDIDNPRNYALELLSAILGGNSASRLTERIRNEHGLAYAVGTWEMSHPGAGQFVVDAGLKQGALDQALDIIVGELVDLRDGNISEDEFELARSFKRGRLALRYDDPDRVASFYSTQELLSKGNSSPQGHIDAVQAVTLDEVKAVAAELISADRARLAIVSSRPEDPTPFEPFIDRLG